MTSDTENLEHIVKTLLRLGYNPDSISAAAVKLSKDSERQTRLIVLQAADEAVKILSKKDDRVPPLIVCKFIRKFLMHPKTAHWSTWGEIWKAVINSEPEQPK